MTEFIADEKILRETYHIKGRDNVLLVRRLIKTVKRYRRLTVRQVFYLTVSRFKYPATRAFYKRLDRYLTKIRRVNPEVHQKFIDPTRRFYIPHIRYPKIEIWVEKDSIRNFIAPLAAKYRLGIQVLKGFASLSMYRKALERARKRKVTTVLYIGDFDPSGLLIEKVAEEEMKKPKPIEFIRLALSFGQIRRYRPPSRPVNLRGSRAKEYIKKYGDRCWEVEAIRPRTLYRLIEKGLKENVPPEFLAEAARLERAAKIARPVAERLRKAIEREVLRLLAAGLSEGEIRKRIREKYGF